MSEVLRHVINELAAAKAGSRELDVKIGQLMGWRRRVEQYADDQGSIRDRELWIVPERGEPGRVPRYTTDLQRAYELAVEIDPEHVAGCAWEPGSGSAKWGDGESIEAATPALALCIVALMRHPLGARSAQTQKR